MPRQIPARTLKILRRKDGVLQARLSPDLNIAKSFGWYVDRENKRLYLERNPTSKARLKVWGSNPKGRSAYIGAVSFVKELGLDPKKIEGRVLDVKVDDQVLEVQF